MADPRPPVELDKALYSLPEVALITRRPLGLVKRWVWRQQLRVVWLEDGTPCVAAADLRERLTRRPRIERLERGLRRRRQLGPGSSEGEAAGA